MARQSLPPGVLCSLNTFSGCFAPRGQRNLNLCESEHGRLELVIVHEPGLEAEGGTFS